MQQKLTTILLLSTVIGISAGTSAEASGSLLTDLSTQELPTSKLLDRHFTTEVKLVEDASATGDRVIDDNSASIEAPSPKSDWVGDAHAPSVVTSPKAFDATEAIPLPEPMVPEEIGGLNLRQSGVMVSQQVPATPPPADSLPEPLPEAEPEIEDPDPVLPTTPVPPPESAEPPPETGPTVTVQRFEVLDSTVFDESDFDTVLSSFVGRALGIDELRQAADSITQLYLNEGYITSRAVLPNQPITDGVVKLQIIEGSLEEIRIEEADRLANYVRSRINLGAKTPLNQFDLEDQLRLLRADPLIDNIEASLRAGTGLGQSILVVRIDEAEQLEAHLTLDTDSPVSVGVVRMGANVTYRNPLGIGDQIRAAAYRATTGGSHLYELSYSAPINPMNGTISARFLPSEFEIISPQELASFDIEGDAQVYELTYRQPLVRNPREEFALSLGFRHRDGDTRIASTDFSSNSASVIQFGQDYLRRDPQGAWALRSQFSLGVDWLDATNLSSPQADSQFVGWLGQVQRAQVLNPDHLLIIQGDVQLASDTLLGSEQFVIGGRQSVRGYSQNARFGDNGVRLSVEDRITIQRDESGAPIMLLSPFIDMAAVWNTESGTTVNDDRFLLGTGVGFTYRPVEKLNLRLDLGVPLVDIDDSAPQDVFLYLDFDLEL
ncbi:ShlB/FhaC/HecB family hemolysin secretion/activation protein [Adonisia turfae]|uniref:ShlB/FhaC/HecB family hemolysin secretion/activation protein n=1 Tax=Adonisia turfae CCMR0081 TaxID=2292702 RepID=A0A6M0RN20_9CYAN|nr:ShlB/FhaC/HecB family hemolysin secretion/activation protein [Adonisia turfae]NEZ57041.1 ShlB/FhaC/HecB family hemolysin secretion/activation protein [Adonisia turfae CCMR0081]